MVRREEVGGAAVKPFGRLTTELHKNTRKETGNLLLFILNNSVCFGGHASLWVAAPPRCALHVHFFQQTVQHFFKNSRLP